MLEFFCENYYWSTAAFLNPQQVKCLLQWGQELEEEGYFKRASIGKGHQKQKNSEVRSDKIFWIDNFQSERGQLVQSIFSPLQQWARTALFLPSRRYECHLTKYEPGGFYRRHRDRHSFSPSRLLTCVIYLTEHREQDGGELILYDENLQSITIHPEPGRVIVFDSNIEHEVLPCRSNRWSLTGWIRSDLHPGLRF